MKTSSPTVTIRALRPLAAILQARGSSPPTVLGAAGVAAEKLIDSNHRIPHPNYLEVWRCAEKALGDADVGLRSAQMMTEQVADVLSRTTEYGLVSLVTSSETLGSALTRAVRYYALNDAGPTVELTEHGDALQVTWLLPSECKPPRSYVDYAVGSFLRTLLCAVARPVAAREVCFTHVAPVVPAPYLQVLDAPVRFGAPSIGVVIAKSDLTVPLRNVQPPAALAELEQRVARELMALTGGPSVAERLRSVLEAELAARTLSRERAAATLAMSVRTLSRRLRAEGTSFHEQLDRVRATLARRYVTEGDLSMKQIAGILGYSDAASFVRAFRRWYGTTPSELPGSTE